MAKREIPVEEVDNQHDSSMPVGKGRATPTRKEREAAQKKPLIPQDRKEAARTARTQTTIARERARAGMAAGEERYLLARDKGPQRRFVRDYVDARFSIGEVILPVMFGVILLTLVPETTIQTYLMLVLYAFVLVVLIDLIILCVLVMKKIKEKFGSENVERGLRWYAAMRALQLRRMRLPKPQVKRRQYPS